MPTNFGKILQYKMPSKTVSSEDLELLQAQTERQTQLGQKTHICNSSFRTVQKITHTNVLVLKHHAVMVEFHVFLTLTYNIVGYTLRPFQLPYPSNRMLDGFQDRSGRKSKEKKPLPLENECQPVSC
jgi:hypothetical protein